MLLRGSIWTLFLFLYARMKYENEIVWVKTKVLKKLMNDVNSGGINIPAYFVDNWSLYKLC